MLIAAIDPGLQGGLAIVNFRAASYEWRPTPIVKVALGKRGKQRSWIDLQLVGSFFAGRTYDALVLEAQAPRPAEGVVSAHTNGANLGMLRSLTVMLSSRKLIMPHPVTWKSELGVPADKKEATAVCRDIFGDVSPEKDGPAEALLLAYWYWKRRKMWDEHRADDGVLVEPRKPRTRNPFLSSHDPGRSGTFDPHGYAPAPGRVGHLFARSNSVDGSKAGARRRGSRPTGD